MACAPPPTSTRWGCWRADRARTRGLARRLRAGADRRARLHRGHQPGREHEARGRRDLSLSGRADAGVPIGLGTDGAGSNDSLDLFTDLKTFALVQKHAAADATAIAAEEAWAIATGQRASLLGAGRPLTVGAAADFLLLRPRAPELTLGELASNLVYAASGAVVETVVVAGQALMRAGEPAELDEIVARAAERARRLGL